jgi:hypothetical protein
MRRSKRESKHRIAIERILEGRNGLVDLNALRALAVEAGGFMTNALRQRAWPLLLGIDRSAKRDTRQLDLSSHRDARQVSLDIPRSLFHFDAMKRVSVEELRRQQARLGDVVNTVLVRHPRLNYLQGFHDVCSIPLLVSGSDVATATTWAETLAVAYFETALRSSITPIVEQVGLLDVLVRHADAELAEYIVRSGVQPFFAVSWVITWFAHNFAGLAPLTRVWDVLIGAHPMMSLYVSAALVLQLRPRIMAAECEHTVLHALLQRPPVDDLPGGGVDELVRRAAALFADFPPARLEERVRRGATPSPTALASLPTVRPNPHLLVTQPSDAALSRAARDGRRRQRRPASGSEAHVAARPAKQRRRTTRAHHFLCPRPAKGSPQRALHDLIYLLIATYTSALIYASLRHIVRLPRSG